MIILFSGAHGTGKSTQNEMLQNSNSPLLKDYEFVDNVATNFFKFEDFKDKETLPVKQQKFTEYQLSIFDGRAFGERVISSRSHADIWAYTKHAYEQDFDNRYKKQLELIEQRARERPANLYFFFPIAFELKAKELRSANTEFQEEIQEKILEFYNLMDIDPYKLQSLTVKDRDMEIKDQICNLYRETDIYGIYNTGE